MLGFSLEMWCGPHRSEIILVLRVRPTTEGPSSGDPLDMRNDVVARIAVGVIVPLSPSQPGESTSCILRRIV